MENKWILQIAIHRGTLISRDIGDQRPFDTREKAVKAYQDERKFYARLGYMIWFAYLTDPDGNKTCLESNSYV